MSGVPLSLRLIGYYRCAGHGFAMPLYGESEGANTFYIARGSLPGDHGAAIEAFEPVEVDDQRRLPYGDSIAVDVGDPWRDVFLWNDAAYVGTPEQLWAELTPQHADVEGRAPLSLLALAVHAGRTEVADLAPVALAFVRQRFGEEKAKNWRRQFLRQHAEVEFRRALIAPRLDSGLFQAVSLREENPDVLTLDLPEDLPFSSASEAVELCMARIAQLSGLLGATITPLVVGRGEEPAAPMLVSPPAAPTPTKERAVEIVERAIEQYGAPIYVQDGVVQNQHVAKTLRAKGAVFVEGLAEVPHGVPVILDDLPVLVIAEGKRAREVVRHLRLENNRSDAQCAIMTSNEVVAKVDQLRTKSVIALVLGEDDQELEHLNAGIDEFLEQQAAAGVLILIVPALPTTQPSALLDSGSRQPRMAHAVLDTAIARSPFWWGNVKRSFDRRIADVIQLAVNAAQSPVVRRELLEPRSGEAIPILSVGFVPHRGERESLDEPSNLRLGSEASWVTADPKRNDPAILFSVRINPDEAESFQHDSQLIVEGRRRENRFPEFAGRVLAPIFGRRNRPPLGSEWRLEQLSGLPIEITEVMRTPDYTGVFAISGTSGNGFTLVVTGETPSLDAVDEANRLGWKMVRYTDTSTLRRLSDGTEPAATIPDEVDIGVIRSHEINRRLATRGIDQRDVIRISYDLLSEWLDEVPAVERRKARRNARPLRSATRPYGVPENDHLLLRDYVLGTDAAARRLLFLIAAHGKRLPERRPMKRFSDLSRCWTPPSSGFQRYAIADGVVPAILLELRDEEVPLQDLFVIDGDFAVPALFRSRVFAVWARATLPAASSWMARFSVANTFGGFPIPDIFRVVGQEGSLAALVADGAPAAMSELVREIAQHIDRALASQPSGNWKEAHRSAEALPAMHRLNELVLNAYNLPGDATDILILRRLLEMNAEFDHYR